MFDIISVKLPKRIEPKNCAADVECIKNEHFHIFQLRRISYFVPIASLPVSWISEKIDPKCFGIFRYFYNGYIGFQDLPIFTIICQKAAVVPPLHYLRLINIWLYFYQKKNNSRNTTLCYRWEKNSCYLPFPIILLTYNNFLQTVYKLWSELVDTCNKLLAKQTAVSYGWWMLVLVGSVVI